MKSLYRSILISAALGLSSPLVHAQAVLNKTTLGQSQNSGEDLANSLVPGPERVGKGEKKSEVDPRTLPSKSVKDTTFEGSLADIGLDWTGDKFGKLHGASAADSKTAKQSDTGGEKDPKVSKKADASADKDSKGSKSTDAAAAGQNKDQKTTTATEGKPAASEKPSPSKTDSNH